MTEALWIAVTSWFTPTVLFCVLNLTIATIFVTSSLKSPRKQEQKQSRVICEDDDAAVAGQIFRVPSLLERVKSINFSRRRAAEQPNPSSAETTQYEEHVIEQVETMKDDYEEHVIDQVETMKDDDEDMDDDLVERSKSLTSTQAPVRDHQAKMKKSLSEKMVRSTKEEEKVQRRRLETVRERKAKWDETTSWVGEDEAVDAKADDFINRFKQQLKLQRIDSILRGSK